MKGGGRLGSRQLTWALSGRERPEAEVGAGQANIAEAAVQRLH